MAEHMMSMTFEGAKGRGGYNRILAQHRNPARTRDGYIALLPYTREQWRAFFREAGRGDMVEDPRVNDSSLRAKSIGEIYAIMAGEVAKRTTAEWLDICARADVPAFPISELEDLPEHPHLKAVKLFQTMPHPTEGDVHYVRPTTIFSETPASVRRHAPNLGEHSQEILSEAGFSTEEIAALRAKGVLGGKAPAKSS
jgi:formyl-CoA transferase